MTDKKAHYVDNVKFYEEMKKYIIEVNKAKKKNEKIPMVSEYIAECFFEIAKHLTHRPNFINYSYRDDLISDGVESCLLYAHNFNPLKFKNPFSYFTLVIFRAFVRRIKKENKQLHLKYRIIEASGIVDDYDDMIASGLDEYNKRHLRAHREFLKSHESYAHMHYNKKKKETKKSSPKKHSTKKNNT